MDCQFGQISNQLSGWDKFSTKLEDGVLIISESTKRGNLNNTVIVQVKADSCLPKRFMFPGKWACVVLTQRTYTAFLFPKWQLKNDLLV